MTRLKPPQRQDRGSGPVKLLEAELVALRSDLRATFARFRGAVGNQSRGERGRRGGGEIS